MRKVFFVILVLMFAIVVGCGNKNKQSVSVETSRNSEDASVEKIIYASPERSCTCPVDVETVDRLVEVAEIAKTKGASFEQRAAAGVIYDELVSNGKIILVKRDARVSCYYSEKYRDFVPVIFNEGELKGKRVYVLEKRLQ